MGGAQRIDQALYAVKWVLSVNAEVYPVLPGRRSLRLVTTDPFTTPEGRVPRLRMYFKIIDDDLVELVWIEEST